MGIFHEQVEIINRTSKPLNVRFDGQDMVLEPNYTPNGTLIPDAHNLIPPIAVDFAKAQNTLMGSEDPLDPSDFQVLVGVKVAAGKGKQKDEISFLEQSKELTRVKLADLLDDPSAKIIVAGRKVKNSEARGAAITPFEPREA